jgi:hypothetical protein
MEDSESPVPRAAPEKLPASMAITKRAIASQRLFGIEIIHVKYERVIST